MWWKTFMDAANLIWSAINGEHYKYVEYNRITNTSTFCPVYANKMVYLFFYLEWYSLQIKRTELVKPAWPFHNCFVEFQNWWVFSWKSRMFFHGMHSTMYIGQVIKWFVKPHTLVKYIRDWNSSLWTFSNF